MSEVLNEGGGDEQWTTGAQTERLEHENVNREGQAAAAGREGKGFKGKEAAAGVCMWGDAPRREREEIASVVSCWCASAASTEKGIG